MTPHQLQQMSYDLCDVMESIFVEFIPPYEVGHESVEITLDGDDVTFDLLAKLSETFKTKNINVRSVTQSSSGCETCNFEWTETRIMIAGIREWPVAVCCAV